MADLLKALEEIGRGADPGSVGLRTTREGYTDLRGWALPAVRPRAAVRTPQGRVGVVGHKPTVRNCRLRRVDLSRASIENSYWVDVDFEDVRLLGVRAQGATFASGCMARVAFTRGDLRNTAWGQYGSAGPDITDGDFNEADMRTSHYSHPFFRRCTFARSRLDQVDFRGSRFEDCKFEGRYTGVWFRREFRDPDPTVAALQNTMKDVDFSKAELASASFVGVDLRSARLPTSGHLVVPNPRRVFAEALGRVERGWPAGDARDRATSYLRSLVAYRFKEDIPIYPLRVQDLLEPPFGPQVGQDVLRELRKALEERTPGGF